MSNLSIPSAVHPHGNIVPIEEAIRHKLNYYTCPECGEFVDPRKGTKKQYFAHKKGVLEDTSCSLSSQAGISRMLGDLRTSDIEKAEKERSIRLYIGEEYEKYVECFGVIPSLDWDQIPSQANADELLNQTEIQTSGIKTPPVPQNFHPSESETTFDLDPTADEFRVSISGPRGLDAILGEWTADGLADGDLFIGDQGRARRHRSDRQIKEGEWVYLVMSVAPPYLPDLAEKTSLGKFDILAFPARESTEDLLEQYGKGLTTDAFGFDADVLLPADAHPTTEAPIAGRPEDPVLIGVTPTAGIDPTFEVVSIPKRPDGILDLEPTGPGNPRYWATSIPPEGSRRISIHQRNSNRHRMIHFHAESNPSQYAFENKPAEIGLVVHLGSNDPILLSPLEGTESVRVDADFEPDILPTVLEYNGPEGIDINLYGKFSDDSSLGPVLRRSTQSIEEFGYELSNWVREGCKLIQFGFDGIGTVSIEFPQPEVATEISNNRLEN